MFKNRLKWSKWYFHKNLLARVHDIHQPCELFYRGFTSNVGVDIMMSYCCCLLFVALRSKWLGRSPDPRLLWVVHPPGSGSHHWFEGCGYNPQTAHESGCHGGNLEFFLRVVKIHRNLEMKQLDVVVSPPAFLWDPYLTLTSVTFDLDICSL